jgi:hypothetical protein
VIIESLSAWYRPEAGDVAYRSLVEELRQREALERSVSGSSHGSPAEILGSFLSEAREVISNLSERLDKWWDSVTRGPAASSREKLWAQKYEPPVASINVIAPSEFLAEQRMRNGRAGVPNRYRELSPRELHEEYTKLKNTLDRAPEGIRRGRLVALEKAIEAKIELIEAKVQEEHQFESPSSVTRRESLLAARGKLYEEQLCCALQLLRPGESLHLGNHATKSDFVVNDQAEPVGASLRAPLPRGSRRFVEWRPCRS